MSYKLELLLSLAFLMAVLLLSADLLNVAVIKSSLDALSTTVSYRISKEGTISRSTKNLIASYGAQIEFEEGHRPTFRIGDTLTYYLRKDYDAFVLAKDTMRVSVRRSAVIGYYKN